jgi:YD repeat-containing protein
MVQDTSGYWSYKRQECDATLSTYTIDEGSRPIDNVRVYPKGETVISYTWYPGIGVRSSVDSMGNVAFYEYDLSGRLKAVFDIDGNPVTGYYYRYTTSEEL